MKLHTIYFVHIHPVFSVTTDPKYLYPHPHNPHPAFNSFHSSLICDLLGLARVTLVDLSLKQSTGTWINHLWTSMRCSLLYTFSLSLIFVILGFSDMTNKNFSYVLNAFMIPKTEAESYSKEVTDCLQTCNTWKSLQMITYSLIQNILDILGLI